VCVCWWLWPVSLIVLYNYLLMYFMLLRELLLVCFLCVGWYKISWISPRAVWTCIRQFAGEMTITLADCNIHSSQAYLTDRAVMTLLVLRPRHQNRCIKNVLRPDFTREKLSLIEDRVRLIVLPRYCAHTHWILFCCLPHYAALLATLTLTPYRIVPAMMWQ